MPELILVNMHSGFRPAIIRKPNIRHRGGTLDIPIIDNDAYHVVYHGSSDTCIVLIVEAKRDSWQEVIFGPWDPQEGGTATITSAPMVSSPFAPFFNAAQ